MRLFIALNFNENMKYALLKMQNALKQSGVKGYEKIGNVLDETMKVNRISLMKSEQSKHGMVYTEIGYVKAF